MAGALLSILAWLLYDSINSFDSTLDVNQTSMNIQVVNNTTMSTTNESKLTRGIVHAVFITFSILQGVSASGSACVGYILHTVTLRLAMIIQERATGAMHMGIQQGMSPRSATVVGMRIALGQNAHTVAIGRAVGSTVEAVPVSL